MKKVKEKSCKAITKVWGFDGITLIALVITVIIMLILAGVSISALMGNEGLFARTANAADKYRQTSKSEFEILNEMLEEYDSAKLWGLAQKISWNVTPKTNINPELYNEGKGVKVEIQDDNKDSGYILQYSIDEGASWEDYIEGETEIYINKYNEKVMAQLLDKEKLKNVTGEVLTYNVTNIDTLPPAEFSYTEEITKNTITIRGSTVDTEKPDESASSSIKYKYAMQNTKTEPEWESIEATENNSKTFGGLAQATTYYLYVMAIDEAGNITKASNNGDKCTTAGVKIEANEDDITTTKAKLNATVCENETGIQKYEFYVDDVLYKEVKTSATSTSIELTFTSKEKEESHDCYVRVYRQENNFLDSDEISVAKHVHDDSCYAMVTGRYKCIESWETSAIDGPLTYAGKFKCSRCGYTTSDSWLSYGNNIGNSVHCKGRDLVCKK